MKIGILGTRGIPNAYGGFEQFAEYLSIGLLKKGVEVWVYNSSHHPYKSQQWKGINLIHCFDPEDKIGTPGQFIYDLNCILDARNRNFDIILQLGYTSSSVWSRLFPKETFIATNMDGLEWSRSKYSKLVRGFLKYAQKLAVNNSDLLIADSEIIREYLFNTYHQDSVFIPYGAEIPETPEPPVEVTINIQPDSYFLLIARMQPDNHIEEIIKGVLLSKTEFPLLVIGNTSNKFGSYLVNMYASQKIMFLGSIFDQERLNRLRYYSRLYFHGHSAGGTNPSLLEAMAASSLICAHDNSFNRSVLLDNALFFSNETDIAYHIHALKDNSQKSEFIQNNLQRIKNTYNWSKVIDAYYQAFNKLVEK
ncbi:MAG: DUF1972 domain-containing protein [Bacteroidales bacterium]